MILKDDSKAKIIKKSIDKFYYIKGKNFSLFCFFSFPRAAPAAYGGSQARGRI